MACSYTQQIIYQYVALQRKVLSEFYRCYPDATDTLYLIDFPKTGSINVDGKDWEFRRHGAGIRFESMSENLGCAVDAHKYIGNLGAFDFWRLDEFVSSMGGEIGEEDFDNAVQKLERESILERIGDSHYTYKSNET